MFFAIMILVWLDEQDYMQFMLTVDFWSGFWLILYNFIFFLAFSINKTIPQNWYAVQINLVFSFQHFDKLKF